MLLYESLFMNFSEYKNIRNSLFGQMLIFFVYLILSLHVINMRYPYSWARILQSIFLCFCDCRRSTLGQVKLLIYLYFKIILIFHTHVIQANTCWFYMENEKMNLEVYFFGLNSIAYWEITQKICSMYYLFQKIFKNIIRIKQRIFKKKVAANYFKAEI